MTIVGVSQAGPHRFAPTESATSTCPSAVVTLVIAAATEW